MKLIIFDIDGVFFPSKNFWLQVHKIFDTLEEGKRLIEKNLWTDYEKHVEEVMRLWKGKDARPYYDLVRSLEYHKGVKEIFKHIHDKGYMTAIISASSIEVAKRIKKDFHVDYIFANELIIEEGKVTGEFKPDVGVGMEKKAIILCDLKKKLKLKKEDCIYIGDDKNDLAAFNEVGTAIAFNSNSEELKQAATYVVDSNNLRDLLTYIP